MSEFEYIIGIHTIVLGLATAKLLTTLADTAKYRETIRPFWVHTLWCMILQLTIIGWWYALWRELNSVPEFSYASFLIMFSVSIAFYLMASFLSISISINGTKTVDLEAHFFQIRIPAFISMAYAFSVLIIRAYLVGDTSSTGNSVLDLINYTNLLLTPLAALVLSSRLAQQIIVVVYSVFYLIVEVNQLGVGV
jgi:hypothetical protein